MAVLPLDYGGYGLLSGIGQGLSGGVQQYQNQQVLGLLRQNSALQRAATMKNEGLMEDPTNPGNLVPNPTSELQSKAAGLTAQNTVDSFDPDSNYSQQKRSYYKNVLNSLRPGLGDQSVTDDMSAAELDAKAQGLLPEVAKGVLSAQGRQIVSDRMNERNDIMRANLSERQSTNASRAGQTFEQDPIIKQLKQTTNSLNRAQSLLDGDTPITAKSFNMISQDLANAVAPGGAATEGKVQRENIQSLLSEINNIELKFGYVKDLRKDQPEIVNNVRDLINRVRSDYSDAISNQAENIAQSYQYSSNPQVQSTVKQKLQTYSPKGLLRSDSTNNSHPQDSAAVQWAKQNPNDPRSAKILQLNGVE